MIEEVCSANELSFLGWRLVPTDPSTLGEAAEAAMPSIWQFFVKAPSRLEDDGDRDGFERTLYLVRRRFVAERERQGLLWGDDDDEM
jgi:glutamate synthase (ferredoxin)